MIKAKKICGGCRKIKGVSCVCPTKKPFEGIARDNYPFYNSRRWRSIAKNHKKNNPLCIQCLQEGKTTPVDVTDHITSIDDGGHKTDLNNLQSLCHSCHNKKTGKNKRK